LGTYLGPNPPPKMAAAAAPAAVAAKVDGAAVFKDQCTACHQENAQGVPEQFPPLAKNADLFLSPDYPVRVVLFGLEGKIEVNGKKFDSAMPPLDVLSDQEIAAVVNYVRGHFGNAALAPKNLKPVDASVVAKLRGKKAGTKLLRSVRRCRARLPGLLGAPSGFPTRNHLHGRRKAARTNQEHIRQRLHPAAAAGRRSAVD
jgi:mono/diheme cytochrome c family protein